MKLLKKLDDNLLKGLLVLFIFFIPLYPKFPFQIVNFTYIAIRFDDFLAAIISFVFMTDLIRGKISWSALRFKKAFLVFWAAVFLAFISGVYLTQTIDYPFVGFLHAARRVEYMMLFFIAMTSVKSVKDFKLYLYTLLASYALVLVYGIGQKLYGFPAISTMNPEYSKGRVLTLTPESRLSSTFAGHYDLGAFLVFLYPLVWGTFMYGKNLVTSVYVRVLVFIAGLAPFVMMLYSIGRALYSGSALSVVSEALATPEYAVMFGVAAATLAVYAFMFQFLRKPLMLLLAVLGIVVLIATASRTSSIAFIVAALAYLLWMRRFYAAVLVVAVFGGLTYYDSELVTRWMDTIQIKQIIINEETGEEVVVQKITEKELPAGTSFINLGSTEESSLAAEIKEDLAIKQASLGGSLDTSNYQTVSGFAADTSLSVRLQVSWPRARDAFLRNPLLGTGPSSITEASDGDYVRWLGELGVLGTGAFLFIIGSVLRYIHSRRNAVPEHARGLLWAVGFGTLGLFINAILIDVFEASKVAYMFWLTLGMFVGLVALKKSELEKL